MATTSVLVATTSGSTSGGAPLGPLWGSLLEPLYKRWRVRAPLPGVELQEECSRSRVTGAPGIVPGEAFWEKSSRKRVPGVQEGSSTRRVQ